MITKIRNIVLFAVLFCACQKSKNFDAEVQFIPSDFSIVAIDKNIVNREEYLLHLKREIALTYNHFYQTYGVENSPAFWETPIDSIRPIDYIKDKTNKRLIETKVIHELAKKYQVIKGFNFEEFKNHWQDYNKSRKDKNDNGEVIYGSINKDLASYYNYILSNLKLRLKDKIVKTEFPSNESALKDFYETEKQNLFSYHKEVEVDIFGYANETLPYQEAVAKINDVKNQLDQGTLFNKTLENKFQKGTFKKKVFYDSIPIYGEDNPNELIKRTALKLQPNEYKIVKAQEGAYVVKLKKLSQMKFYPIKEVREQVLQYYQDSKYRSFLDSVIKQTKLIKNRPLYDKISTIDFK